MTEQTQENQINPPVLEPIPVVVEKKKVSPLAIVVLVIVILLVVAGGVYGAYTFGKKSIIPVIPPQTESPTSIPTQVVQPTSVVIPPTNTPDATANWKTAVNNGNKYSFKYPSDWVFSTSVLSSYDIAKHNPGDPYPAGSAKCDISVFDSKTVTVSGKILFFENEIKVFKAQGKYEPDNMDLGNSDVFLIEDGKHSPFIFYCYAYNNLQDNIMKSIFSSFKFLE